MIFIFTMQNHRCRRHPERSDHGNDFQKTGCNGRRGEAQELLGIITDGDLRRMLEKNPDTSTVHARDIMSSKPTTIQKDALAVEALEVLRSKDISQLPVMDGTNMWDLFIFMIW